MLNVISTLPLNCKTPITITRKHATPSSVRFWSYHKHNPPTKLLMFISH